MIPIPWNVPEPSRVHVFDPHCLLQISGNVMQIVDASVPLGLLAMEQSTHVDEQFK